MRCPTKVVEIEDCFFDSSRINGPNVIGASANLVNGSAVVGRSASVLPIPAAAANASIVQSGPTGCALNFFVRRHYLTSSVEFEGFGPIWGQS